MEKFAIKTELYGHLISTVLLDDGARFTHYPYETMVFDRRVDRHSWHGILCKRSHNQTRALVEHRQAINWVLKRIHDEHIDAAEIANDVQ